MSFSEKIIGWFSEFLRKRRRKKKKKKHSLSLHPTLTSLQVLILHQKKEKSETALEHSSTPGLIVGAFYLQQKECLLTETAPWVWSEEEEEEEEEGEEEEGEGEFWALSLQRTLMGFGVMCFSLNTWHMEPFSFNHPHFNVHYDEVCQSNGLTRGHLDCPKCESIFF